MDRARIDMQLGGHACPHQATGILQIFLIVYSFVNK